MNNQFERDYDLDSFEKITAKRFGFELYVTPRLRHYFVDETYEELTSLLARQSAKGVRTFIDVGAHHGFFDVLVGLSNPDCRILAFEPVPENVEIIRRNLGLNSVYADVHQAAVSNVSGQYDFQVSEASDNSGFAANPAAGIVRSIKTDVVRLDEFIDRIEAGPILVKIDAEGNELKVLEGMKQIIDQREDVRLVIEFNPRCLEANGATPEALLDQLDQLGFHIHFVLDDERQYAKFGYDKNWAEYMGGKTSRNLFCVKKDRSLNLCVFNHTASLGGAELSLLELIDSMTKRYGTVFTVILPALGPLQRRIEELGAATILLDYRWWCSEADKSAEAPAKELMLRSNAHLNAALPSLFRLSPDVVLTNTLVLPWGAAAAKRLNSPHVWWVKEFVENDHGLEFYQSRNKTLAIIEESSNHVVVNSEAVKRGLFPAIGSEKCSVAMNCLTLKPHVENAEDYFQRPSSTKAVIAGTVNAAKGQEDAVRAIMKLSQDGRYDVELCIAGTMPPESACCLELRNLVREEGLEDRIHFLGFLENVRPVIEQAHIGLTCSRTEAFGRCTAEAMMLGKPVIGTNSGGTAELIEDGADGFLYSPGDVERLADRIAFFAENPEAIGVFGEKARLAILAKLATNPVDSHMFDLCRRHKEDRNPHSAQLTELLLGWQQELRERPDMRGLEELPASMEVVRLRAELAEQCARLADVHSSTSWRLSAPVRAAGRLVKSAGQAGKLARSLSGRLVR